MTLRDWFAGQALQAIIATIGPTRMTNQKDDIELMIATGAFRMADAMLRAGNLDKQ